MSWEIGYTIEYVDGNCLDTTFNSNPEFCNSNYHISGKTDRDAIECALQYIEARFQEKHFFSERYGTNLIIKNPLDNAVLFRYTKFHASKIYKLINSDGKEYLSTTPGLLGGHRRLKIYGRLDCPSANRYIKKGQYVQHRVFFKDEETAIAAGYRPCAVCMKEQYKLWKQQQAEKMPTTQKKDVCK